jgi:scyllo-inositol 2-dehydrogenase (NAD+)
MGRLTMAPLKGAVVGCGRMGAFTNPRVRQYAPPFWMPLAHAEAMAAQPEISLVALCDSSTEQLARAKERHADCKGYTNYRQLLDEVKPDILGIATRTRERPAIIEEAIASGVRALHIEKPLCNSVAQLTRLEQILTAGPVACTYGTLRRYMPVYGRARDLAESGRFGELQQVHVCLGRAALMWAHPHSLDILRFMALDAPVERVSARFVPSGYQVAGTAVDGDPIVVSALLEFSSGVSGLITQGGGIDIVLHCSKGRIAVESDGHRLICRHSDGQDTYWRKSEEESDASASGGTRLALDRLVGALRGTTAAQAQTDKRAIIECQRLLFACVQSHLAGGVAIDPGKLDPELSVSGRSGELYA